MGVARRVAMGTQQTIEVMPERLMRWCEGFADRHSGVTSTDKSPRRWILLAGDGVRARIEPAFPPVKVDADESVGLDIGDLVEHALAERMVGVLLVRLGAHAAGVFQGSQLVSSKVGRALVHGRSKAGGWSQQRFARRRAGQARESLADAAAVTARILLPEVARLDAVVLGGDRRAIERLRGDGKLAPVFDRAVERFLTVPEPRLAILRGTPRLFRSARVMLEPAEEQRR
jgi:hypothetical protein